MLKNIKGAKVGEKLKNRKIIFRMRLVTSGEVRLFPVGHYPVYERY